ncbi:MAG: hypothetical protein A3H27_02050 [Acidobacteria bacterium RIFCSPLOWO2_02_FULL_59_13]|nr:MAG: hypothetical protein A3H27_02050 [Acidobacteria bacterium RIFCSPLOWO2_02_FULL_59_13]
MPSLTSSHWPSLHGLITATGLLVYVAVLHVLQQHRHPSAALPGASGRLSALAHGIGLPLRLS